MARGGEDNDMEDFYFEEDEVGPRDSLRRASPLIPRLNGKDSSNTSKMRVSMLVQASSHSGHSDVSTHNTLLC